MEEVRFHVVVANYCRARSFVDNFSVIEGFDPSKDCVVFLDCSPQKDSREQLQVVAHALRPYGLDIGKNLVLIRRESRLVSHGAQLDYLDLLSQGAIPTPRYTFFMQDHYLDRCADAKEDVLPEGFTLDLDAIADHFEYDPELGCVFAARNGIRVSMTTPYEYRAVYGAYDESLPGSEERCFFVDGGNFFVRPQLYLSWLQQYRHVAFCGLGDYGDAFVWEIRLGKILYDQGVRWRDLVNQVSYITVSDLRKEEARAGREFSKRWYDHRKWFAFHGRDITAYRMRPLGEFVKPMFHYLHARLCKKSRGSPEILMARESLEVSK